MRFRLRYQQHDFDLGEGQFSVGRSASCQLSLDDPLVSRKHAIFEVTSDGVTLEDLDSRNGVTVNGERIQGRVLLRSGDRTVIGSQELVLTAIPTRSNVPTGGPMTMPKMRTQSPSSAFSAHASDSGPDGTMVRRADQFRTLGAVANKAFAMGRAGEAERLLASPLADVIEAMRAGRLVPPALVDEAARFSAKLATATGKGGWADYVIELYEAQRRPPPADVIAEMYNALRKVSNVDVNRLRRYVTDLREMSQAYGPADRFLVQRLEGLERLASLR